MSKYDWKQLEKEYILSDYKSVSSFLNDKGIKRNGSTQKAVKGWNEKKVQKEFKKGSKIIEKVIEKESEKEAQQIITVKDVATELMKKISDSANKIGDSKEIKQLTSALKDINDIIGENKGDNEVEDLTPLIKLLGVDKYD